MTGKTPGPETCWHFLIKLNKACFFQTTEGTKVGKVSNSELKRWLQAKCVEINFEAAKWDEPMPPFIKSFVLFPKNPKRRCTLFWDPITLVQVNIDVN